MSIDDIRTMRPDEIFLYVSSARNRLGNTAEEQQNKIAVCGESILAVGNSLEKINGIGEEGIIPDSTVQSRAHTHSLSRERNRRHQDIDNHHRITNDR